MPSETETRACGRGRESFEGPFAGACRGILSLAGRSEQSGNKWMLHQTLAIRNARARSASASPAQTIFVVSSYEPPAGRRECIAAALSAVGSLTRTSTQSNHVALPASKSSGNKKGLGNPRPFTFLAAISYFSAVAIEWNLVLRLVPRVVRTVMSTTAMRLAIRPYSIEIGPDLSCG